MTLEKISLPKSFNYSESMKNKSDDQHVAPREWPARARYILGLRDNPDYFWILNILFNFTK